MKLWVVGEVIKNTRKGQIWECVGVFDSAKLAESSCLTRRHFVGPLDLNDIIQGSVEWEGCYFPNADGSTRPWPRPEGVSPELPQSDDKIPMPEVKPLKEPNTEERTVYMCGACGCRIDTQTAKRPPR